MITTYRGRGYPPKFAVLLNPQFIADDSINYNQSVKATFGEPLENSIGKVDVVFAGELDF